MDVGGDDTSIDEQLNASAAVAAARAAADNDGDLPSTTDLNISDVLDAITKAEQSFPGAGAGVVAEEEMARHAAAAGKLPYVEIVEQPAPKALRFRYECEGRSAGSIPGISSTNENKTYPTIRIHNYVGEVTVVVSCVTKDKAPKGGYWPHPHNLVGRERCNNGVCTVKTMITAENCDVQFKNLGIQCIRKRDVKEHLDIRSKLRVDPFKTGFDHRNSNSLDLNQVRLAFQVFLSGINSSHVALDAVASDVIVDKKAMGELVIVRVGTVAGSARGGTQVIVLCEKVTKDETVVEFFEESSGWEVCVQPLLVHKQYAVVFDTPPYRDPRTPSHAVVKFRLRRINTGETEKDVSNSFPFEYIPDETATVASYSPANQIKLEPDRTPPYQHIYSPQAPALTEQQQMWNNPLESLQGLGAAGSNLNPFAMDLQWPHYQQSLSPMAAHGSPIAHPQMGHVSPGLQQMSPGLQQMGQISPGLQHQQQFSPIQQQMEQQMGQQLSPGLQRLPPMSHASPGLAPPMSQSSTMGHISPGLVPPMSQSSTMGHISPGLVPPMSQPSAMGHISPGLHQQQQHTYQNQQQMASQPMDTSSTSFSALLRAGVGGGDEALTQLALNSADLLSLVDGPLQRLSTNEYDPFPSLG